MVPVIVASDLYKTYWALSKPVEVLKGVQLEIEAGEALSIMGVSGAGKSTLLHILGTIDKPSSGAVTFEGTNLFSMPESKLSEFRNRSMGFVFQFHHLLPMLTAEENVMLPLMIAGWSQARARGEAGHMLSKVRLGDRLRHRPAELSGGEQQRVAIARALMMKPKVLFADEPTGNLDSRTGEEIADLLLELHRQYGMTMLIVTHNEKLAARLPQRLWMTDGRVLRQ